MERKWIIQILLSWAMKLSLYEDNEIRTTLSVLRYSGYRERVSGAIPLLVGLFI